MQLNLRKNAIWALIEVLTSVSTLFLMYRIIIDQLGAKALGIWSLVVATTAFGRLADPGTTGGLSRFLATAHANNNLDKQIDYAETGLLTSLAFSLAIALVLWLPAYYGLSLAMPAETLAQGRALLPFALTSYILMSLAAATSGMIVGQHRSDIKSKIAIVSVLLQFCAALSFLRQHGLFAIAWAQIFQYVFICAAGWFLFLKNLYGTWTFRLPLRWRREILKELLSFGIKMQAVSIVSTLFEPLAKYAMSAMGGLEALGYYEMAQKAIQQARQLVVNPFQPLVPSFAHISASTPEKIAPIYRKSVALATMSGIPILGGIVLTSPLISLLWLGRMEPTFIFFLCVLPFGWLLNLLAAPAYLMGIGTGRLKGNFYGTCVMTFGGFLLGLALGFFFQERGVSVGSSLMIGLGGVLTMRMNCRALNVKCLPTREDFKTSSADIRARLVRFIPGRKTKGRSHP